MQPKLGLLSAVAVVAALAELSCGTKGPVAGKAPGLARLSLTLPP